jgi:putative tricarboxylic transport membrane protein
MTRRAEQIACVFWVVLSAALCVKAVSLKLGAPSDPGPGFLPFGTGALMGILALAHLLKVSRPSNETVQGEPLWQGLKWKRCLSVVLAVFVYALLLPYLGYVVTTFFFMLVLFSLYGRKRRWLVIVGSLLVIGVTYWVFHIWLQVQFPSGLLGIG